MREIARSVLLICLLSGAVAGLISCKHQAPTSALRYNAEHGFIKETPPNQKLLVVFVHGIFGSGADTWVGGKNDSLPALVAFDPRFGSSLDVMVYQYETPMLTKAGRISDVAEDLAGYLDHKEIWTHYRGVIFVGHSMGGLVIRQFLISHQSLAPNVPLIYLYATPTDGSEAATVASKISQNRQLRGMFPIEGNTYLDSVVNNWTNNPELSAIPTYCSYEGYDTYGIRIVSQSSASALCKKATHQYADHIDIVKPMSRDDPRYYMLQLQLLKLPGVQSEKPEEMTQNENSVQSVQDKGPEQTSETIETYRSPEIVGWGKNFSPPYTLCTPDKPGDWSIVAVTDFHLESATERGTCNQWTSCGGSNTDTSAHVCRTVSVQGHDENRFDGYGRAVAVLEVKWKHPPIKK